MNQLPNASHPPDFRQNETLQKNGIIPILSGWWALWQKSEGGILANRPYFI